MFKSVGAGEAAPYLALGVDMLVSFKTIQLGFKGLRTPPHGPIGGGAFVLEAATTKGQKVGFSLRRYWESPRLTAEHIKALEQSPALRGFLAAEGRLVLLSVDKTENDPGGTPGKVDPANAPAAASPYAHLRPGWTNHIDSVVDGLVASGRPKTVVLGEGGQGKIRSFVNREPNKMTEFLEMRPNSLDYTAQAKAGTLTPAMEAETLDFNLLMIERLQQGGSPSRSSAWTPPQRRDLPG